MNLFEKRPLSLVLAITLCGFSFMATSLRIAKIAVAIVLTGLAAAAYFFAGKRKLLIAMGIGLLTAAVFSELYFGVFFFPEARFTTSTYQYTATVTDADYFETQGARYTLKTDAMRGKPFSSYSVSYTDFVEEYAVGDRVKVIGKIRPFGTEADGFNAKAYYASNGISGELCDIESIEVLDEKADIPLAYRLKSFRKSIADYACELCGKQAGGLLAAVLLGERSCLPGQLKLDFTAIGITHLLALSGMHLSILTAGLYFLLKRMQIGKRLRFIIADVFAVLYVLLTGASPSVVRAASMLILGSLLYLAMRGKDGVTSLLVAVTSLFIIKPYAVFGASIWLSAFATLGILIYAELIRGRKKAKSKAKQILRYFVDGILCSFFAVGGTLILSVLYFDSLSLLSPITTLLFSILIEIMLYIGIPVLLMGRIFPIGIIIKPIASLISSLSGLLADISGLSVSTESLFIRLFAVAFSVAFIAFAVLKFPKRKLMAACLCVFLFAGLGIGALITDLSDGKDSILYLRDGKDEALCITDSGDRVIIEMTDLSANDFRALLSKKPFRAPIDCFVITHYEKNLMTSAGKLLSLARIKSIALPEAKTNAEAEIALAVLDAAAEYRTDVVFYNTKENMKIGSSEVAFLYRSEYGDGAPRLLFSLCRFDRLYSYFSSGVMLDDDIKNEAAKLYDASATAIFGSHGKTYPEGTVFDYSSKKVEELLISDERFLFKKSYAEKLEGVNFIYLSEKEELIR